MELWSTFRKQMKSNAQASFELRILRISLQDARLYLQDLIGKFNHLEELYIRGCWDKTDMTSLLQSLQQLNNLRLLELWGDSSLSGKLNLSKGRDSTNLEASTNSRMYSLESITFVGFKLSKLVISGEMCPRLRSLTVCNMDDLNGMDLQELERLNTLRVDCCPKLETISGLSSLTGLQILTVTRCSELETISGLSSLTGLQFLTVTECFKLETISGLSYLQFLERINIGGCDQLQRIKGVEELQGLKSLVILVYEFGDPSVCNCIYGLRSLPSEYTILIGKVVYPASSRLNANLFSEVIGGPAVAEIERGKYGRDNPLEMRSSSSAIPIYALHVSSLGYYPILETPTFTDKFPYGGEWMVTGLLTEHNSNVSLGNVRICKVFMVTVNKNEEEKALNILQIIVNRLYRQSGV